MVVVGGLRVLGTTVVGISARLRVVGLGVAGMVRGVAIGRRGRIPSVVELKRQRWRRGDGDSPQGPCGCRSSGCRSSGTWLSPASAGRSEADYGGQGANPRGRTGDRGRRYRWRYGPGYPEREGRWKGLGRTDIGEPEYEEDGDETADDVDGHENHPGHQQPVVVDGDADEQQDGGQHNEHVEEDVQVEEGLPG